MQFKTDSDVEKNLNKKQFVLFSTFAFVYACVTVVLTFVEGEGHSISISLGLVVYLTFALYFLIWSRRLEETSEDARLCPEFSMKVRRASRDVAIALFLYVGITAFVGASNFFRNIQKQNEICCVPPTFSS